MPDIHVLDDHLLHDILCEAGAWRIDNQSGACNARLVSKAWTRILEGSAEHAACCLLALYDVGRALSRAVDRHKVDVVKKLLDTSTTSPELRGLALKRAASTGFNSIIVVLIEAGVHSNDVEEALRSACEMGLHDDTVELLLATLGQRNASGDCYSVLKSVAIGGSVPMLEKVKNAFDWGCESQHKPAQGRILVCALHWGNIAMVRALLEWDWIALTPDFCGGMLFIEAAATGQVHIMDRLLGFEARGGSERAMSLEMHGGPAMVSAVGRGRINVVEWLIEAGVPPIYNDGQALVQAATMGYLNIVNLLLSKGVPPSIANNEALISAAESGWYQIVVRLLSAGVPANVRNNAALLLACGEGHRDIVELLLQQEKSAPFADALDGAALIGACAGGHIDVVELLINWKTHAPHPDAYKNAAFYAASPFPEIRKLMSRNVMRRRATELATTRRTAGSSGQPTLPGADTPEQMPPEFFVDINARALMAYEEEYEAGRECGGIVPPYYGRFSF